MTARIFRPPAELTQVFLYRDPIDFRKSYRGLAAIIEFELGNNPCDGSLYVFTNRQRNKIKCLFWETNGFVLYYKALAEEKFKWPKPDDNLLIITGEQMNWLLDGYDISRMKPHKTLTFDSYF